MINTEEKALSKDEIYVADIFDMTFEGKGTAKVNDIVVFVDNAVVGDKVKIKLTKIKKRYAFGRVVEVLEYSKHRVKPACDVYKYCGGCDLLHLDYETQAKLKLESVRSILKNTASVDKDKITDIKHSSQHDKYRNKYYVQAKKVGAGYLFGHFQEGTNNLVETNSCLLTDDKTNEIINKFDKVINSLNYDCSVKNILVRTNKDKSEYIVCIVFKSSKIKDKNVFINVAKEDDKIKGLVFNYNFDYKGDILGRKDEVVYGENFIYDEIGNYKFKVAYNAFFQVNSDQTETLYNEIVRLGNFTKDDVVLDAYSGAGTIGIYIADKVKSVVGIEVVESAVENAKENKELNNVENISFVCGKVEEEIQKVMKDNENITTVILDPPRKGCDDKVLDSIIENNIENIVYVSCKADSLGKDLKYLQEHGYDLVEGVAVDMFVNTTHVETVARIAKVKN